MPNNFFPPLASVGLAVLMLLGLAACDVSLPATQQPTPTPAPTAPPPTPTPLPRGGNLTIAIAQDVTQLQPWSPADRGQEQLVGLVYRGLMRLGPDLAPQPDLAESWQASPDGLTLTFTLRSGLTWHDDRPLEAEDVAWTINSMRELSPSSALLADYQRVIAAVDAPAPNTVVLTLTERYAPLLAELSVPVLPRHLLQNQGLAEFDFWRTPVGSGPFAFESRTPGESIVLTASPTFYGGQPLLDRVALVVSPDADVTREALGDGRALLGELTPDSAATLSNTTRLTQELRFGSYPENGYYFLGFNVLEGRLFADGRLRQALALAVDVPALVAEVTGETGLPIGPTLRRCPALPSIWRKRMPCLKKRAGCCHPTAGCAKKMARR
jgi:peptide/nickel transport system substrate-binding protein